jgi:hypothetical protein
MGRRRSYHSNAKAVSGSPKLYSGSILSFIPTNLLPSTSSSAYIPATSVNSNTVYSSTLSLYEESVIKILDTLIDAITERINLDTILDQLTPLQTKINTLAEAESLIFRIQNIILGIVDNIKDRVQLDLVLDRLNYLQIEINQATCLPEVYDDIADLLISIIDSITKRENLDTALQKLQTVNTTMIPDVTLANDILALQTMILTVIDNITNRANLNLVLERLKYIQQGITNVIDFQNTL